MNPKSTYPIKATLSLHPKEHTVRFSINEQFQIDHIQGGGKRFPFQQQGNVVQVQTNGAPSMTIYYRHTFGSTFYPLISGVTLLPFEANWYPQSMDSTLYDIDSSGTLHSNVETKTCTRVNMIVGKEKYRWHGSHLPCLSLINGPYKQIQVQHTRFLVYKPFLTTRRNYMELGNSSAKGAPVKATGTSGTLAVSSSGPAFYVQGYAKKQINWWPDSIVASAIAYPSQTVKNLLQLKMGLSTMLKHIHKPTRPLFMVKQK
ncbi:hypothetical protein B4113_3023 [Geobacillus sp. B4113_201601]|nr:MULTISPECIES: hypothetical protein [Geobacillus]KYD23658.1 hypothetical protein B4113_3023 [Geobacillus sp. B4113_201601]